MTKQQLVETRALQGRLVSVALSDGSRIDDGRLVSAGMHGGESLWIDSNGLEVFIPFVEVVAVWESLR